MSTAMDPLTQEFLAAVRGAGKAHAAREAPAGRRTDDAPGVVRDPARLALIGGRIAAARAACGLLLTGLARRLKVTNSFLAGIERGTSPTKLRTYRKIALALGLSLESLIAPE